MSASYNALKARRLAGQPIRGSDKNVSPGPAHAVPGRCIVCRCTDARACAMGCSWANADQTVCTACVDPDDRLDMAAFQRRLFDILADPAAARAARRPQ